MIRCRHRGDGGVILTMRPQERRESSQTDLFRARLDQIVNLAHPLVTLAGTIDWGFLETRLGELYDDAPGRPPLPPRLMAGLAILKHLHDLSDEALCARWLENPYFQLLCGEEFFQHQLPFERSSLTRWRQRLGEERLLALLQESLSVATRTGAAKPADFTQVILDTTVQEKAITFPTDAKLMHRARERLVRLAKAHGVTLRQSYARVGKVALIQSQRYAHAKQFRRANRALRRLRTMLGRVIRDLMRKIHGKRAWSVSLPSRSPLPGASRTSASASSAGRSTACMRPRWNASARARRTSPTSSA
jgi:transposase, IS5 family